MNFSRQNISNYLLYGTDTDNLFISEYMPQAKGEHVKQYLMALMYAQMRQPLDNEQLAKKLGTDLPSVLAGWDYWEEQGVVVKVWPDPEDKLRYEIEFVNLREQAFGPAAKSEDVPPALQLSDASFARLLRDIEAETGRLLASREPEEIASWIADYGMDPQVILFGYRFCAQNRKSNSCRYVGRVLKDWLAKGLTTRAQVEEYLAGVDQHYEAYRRIFRELGFHRQPSEPEKQIMNRWFDELGCTLEEILDACKATSGISNPNINYVNSVLVGRRREKQAQEGGSQGEASASVEALYERDREENEEKSAALRREIIEKIPRIGEIQSAIRDTSYRISRSVLSQNAGQSKALRDQMNKLYEERAALLAENGYPKEALDPVYTCPDCRDTGFLRDGTRCHCYAEKLARLGKSAAAEPNGAGQRAKP